MTIAIGLAVAHLGLGLAPGAHSPLDSTEHIIDKILPVLDSTADPDQIIKDARLLSLQNAPVSNNTHTHTHTI